MRSYEAARSMFAFLSVLSWGVIIIAVIAALMGGNALSEMMNYREQTIGFLLGMIPGAILAFVGFLGLVFAQIGRAGVDTAEYCQQSLQISRDQLEVSKQALRHGEEVKNGFASLKTQLATPVTASYFGQDTKAPETAPAASPASTATYANNSKAIDYKGKSIQQLAQGFRFAGMEFKSLDAARSHIDELETAPKSLTIAS